MKFGVSIPTSMEGLMYPVPFFKKISDIFQMCQEAEILGFDSVWGNEHITRQEYVKCTWKELPRYIEPITFLSYIAAKTNSIYLGTGVIPLPLRDPILLARQASTLDNISQGRLILGVGLGAYREEFEKQKPDQLWVNRGRMLDEALEALFSLFTKEKASFRGKYYSFSEIEISPKPVQNPLPIYIGGNSFKSVIRAIKYGCGWLPAGLTPCELEMNVSKIKTYLEEYGKSSLKIDIAPQLGVCIADSHRNAIKKYKNSQIYQHDLSLKKSTLKQQNVENLEERDLIGTVDEIIKKIERYRNVGVNHLPALIFVDKTIKNVLKSMQLFAREIMPCFK
jgi:probable F420-dependent oxidoreductase